MKRFLILFAFFTYTVFLQAQSSYHQESVKILPVSKLTISGDTNINTFLCDFNTALLKQSQNINYKSDESRISFKNAILTLNNKGFDCGNKGINKDFQLLLQSEEHPEIRLELKEIRFTGESLANAEVIISIAGEQKNYKVPIEIETSPTAHYQGVLHLNIRDFELKPPKKLFGLIVLKEEIEIKFNLRVQK
ncbi:YceI family protein [Gillisia sp. M10.2A]|uniref:YceI family protein n=1 Tax=Gillisia lutea TaxID=2909668 RepID=A0ABS9EBH2_9FLAO|nr:YceI family protein [Gillisia lutea]MCF4100202.1 YceI family protein [Gillisia lutea]